MTVATMIIGPPRPWHGTGATSWANRPPMVGGLVTSFLLELLVYPAIFAIWKSRDLVAVPTVTAAEN
jgi:Cu(I)/Ag(I) efflux system membrane protein CusA/SilA